MCPEVPKRKEEEEKTSMCALKFRNALVAATLAALLDQDSGLLNPPWPSSLSVLIFAALLVASLCLPRVPLAFTFFFSSQ